MAGEQFTQGLRRNSVSFYLAAPEAVADWSNPTLAELNVANDRLILDVTCALDEEATTMTIGASDTNDRLSFCDGPGIERPSGLNPEAEWTFYRDADRTANGVFNKALAMIMFPDVPLYLLQVVGDQDRVPGTAFRLSDDVRAMRVRTDFTQDNLGEDQDAMITMTWLQDGFVNWNFTPAAS